MGGLGQITEMAGIYFLCQVWIKKLPYLLGFFDKGAIQISESVVTFLKFISENIF